MTRTAQLLVLGSVNRDLVVHAPRLPLPGETLRGHRFGSCLGGKGANQAVAAARLGAHVALAAQVGQLEGGASLLEQLQREGVDLSQVRRPADQVPGVALIVVGAADAENQIVTVAGSNATLDPSYADALRLDGLDFLVAQQELPPELLRRAFQRARAAGVRTLLNAAPFRAEAASLLSDVDLLVVNELEAGSLLGRSAQNAEATARALRERGPAAVLVTLGAAGLVWVDADACLRVPAFPVQAVDTVGAGDTLVGALATALAEGRTPAQALRFAAAAAACAVSRAGVQDAMPHRVEVDAMLRT